MVSGGPLGVLIMERNLLQVSTFPDSFILLEPTPFAQLGVGHVEPSACGKHPSDASRSLKLQLQSRQSGVPIFSC